MGIVNELKKKNENLEMKTQRLKMQLGKRNADNRIMAAKLEMAMRLVAYLVEKNGGRVEISYHELAEMDGKSVWGTDDEEKCIKIMETRGGKQGNE